MTAVLFPQNLLPVSIFFILRNFIFISLEKTFGDVIVNTKSKLLLVIYHCIKMVGVIIPFYIIFTYKFKTTYFVTTENEALQNFPELLNLVSMIPCIVGLQSFFTLNNKNPTPTLNETIKVIATLIVWNMIRIYPGVFDEKFTPGNEIDNVLKFGFAVTFVVFIKNVTEVFFKKPTTDVVETPSKIDLKVFHSENILFHISHLLENISIVKTYEIFLVILISLQTDFYTMILFIVVATPLQHLKKYPKIYELNFTSIFFKAVQFGLFVAGALVIYQMETWDSVTFKNDFFVCIALLLASEVIDAFIFHSITKVTFDLEVLFGNGIMCWIVAIHRDSVFGILKYGMTISFVTNCTAFICFVLFILTKK
eukprot:gene5454-9267_t